ncbi:30S ribosomal protein S20 [Chlamydia trachomatis]|uniref:Small ribosomal subunit protein bS20 n=3 Tax=Chlamydia trachomatis TaxID=813 RepID=RS20_CHLTR|nr:30S ribosomal protein S20 [Chlamydia trachomatis]NP_220134.1 30S ribosomal protein S20 [Chlamydia trachomatis D/UW-3/CX]O84622.1 RecName: Full=Small ribosomal subunit protein bS20; AltName: Full=30S ribosomal protein S20 [Chlamydia trachomatis D/UW-3/CX]Q3KL78.1 RecName: Full=Small ribosomal subunit protein bS20; AltName: Full=30S ribosomal protein S20 [Chlamydia trachomatis A/HAR-13]AAC68221.1 S20 Ribosomal Protein [Chlamydia trachomatis D/UW-3/CX]AAX50894.1 SSU ribosomal protein S20P [Chl
MAPRKPSKKVGPQKRPSAEKRVITSKKKQLRNQSFKSKVRTILKKFELAVQSGDVESISAGLRSVYSIADKAVKRGIFKKGKADRVKSRTSERACPAA